MSIAQDIRLAARHRKETPADLRRRIAEMEQAHADEVARLNTENDSLVCALIKTTGELDQAGIELSGARLDEERIAALLERRNRQVIRQAADLARLRQAVMQARPKITFATAPRVPPFAPLETIPAAAGEPLTVGTWMPFPPDPDGETTVGIALADLLTGRA